MCSCNLCGSVLGDQRGGHWASAARAIYITGRDFLNPKLSGTGRITIPFNEILLPNDPDQSHFDADFDDDDEIFFLPASLTNGMVRAWTTTGFLFHENCYKLLEYACFPGSVDIRILNLILRSFGIDSSQLVVNFGHVYGGLYQSDDENLQSIHLLSNSGRPPGLSMYDKDPLNDVSFSRVLLNLYGSNHMQGTIGQVATEERPLKRMRMTKVVQECFDSLPVEIIDLILGELPSRDVLSARIASRVLAGVPLSQAFWRSRFATGMNLDYIPEPLLFKKKSVDNMFFSEPQLVHKAALDDRCALAMAQRQRIWDLLQPLAEGIRSFGLHEKVAGSVKPCGRPLASMWEPHEQDEDEWRWDCEHGELLDTLAMPYHFGCRPLFKRFVELPSRVTAVNASVLPWHNTTYITGLRFVLRDGSIVPLGYILEDRERTLTVDAGLSGFEVTVSQRGIHALNTATRGWKVTNCMAGDMGRNSVKKLGQGHELNAVKAYFDGMKMVHLAVPGYVHRAVGPYELWRKHHISRSSWPVGSRG